MGGTARRLPAPHRARRTWLRARHGRRDRDPGRAARHPRPAGFEVRRPGRLPAARQGAAGRGGSRGASGRHGRRRHRPGRALPDDRALLRCGRRPGRGGAPRRGLQRLAGRLLRRQSAPALRRRHASAPGPAGRGAASCGGPSATWGSWPASCGPTRAWAGHCVTATTTRCGTPPRSSECRSGSTRAVRSSCRRSPPTGPSTPWCSTPCRTRSSRCSPARSSSPSASWNATRVCVASSWSVPADGFPFGSSAWTSRWRRSAASARTWR